MGANADDIGRILECLLYVAIFEYTLPDTIGASVIMQDACIFQRIFRVHHRIERFVLDLNQLGSIVCNAGRFGHHCRDWFALITHF